MSSDIQKRLLFILVMLMYIIILVLARSGEICKPNWDVFTCKTAGCEFNLELRACQRTQNGCTANGPGLSGCRRANSFYVNKGVISRSLEHNDIGNCNFSLVVLAVHMGSGKIIDSRGIHHENLDGLRLGVHNAQRAPIHISDCADGVLGVPKGDEDIYSYSVWGKGKAAEVDRCISIAGSGLVDGFYELCIRLVEFQDEKGLKRHFNILLNEEFILHELNILKYVDFCAGLELIIEFEVKNEKLYPSGISKGIPIKNGNFKVRICSGEGSESSKYFPGYALSGLYIVRMNGLEGDLVSSCTKCDCSNPAIEQKEELCLQAGCVFNKTLSTCTNESTHLLLSSLSSTNRIISPPVQNCSDKRLLNPNDCKDYGCEYSSSLCLCEPKFTECSSSNTVSGCLRSKSFYNHAGKICYNSEQKDVGDCSVKTIQAVNLGCHCETCKFTDSKGIHYEKDNYRLFSDPDDTRLDGEDCAKETDSDNKQLYANFVSGNGGPNKTGKCLYYLSPMLEDGLYEITIKTLNAMLPNQTTDNWEFDVLINNVVIVSKLRIQRYVKTCQTMDLTTEFKIEDGILTPAGSVGIKLLPREKTTIGFCNGDEIVHPQLNLMYLVSAYYVGKLSEKEKVCNHKKSLECAKFNKNVVKCRAHSCDYNLVSETCLAPVRYTCCKIGLSGCQRAQAFYSVNNVICRSRIKEDKGNCNFSHNAVMEAVNFGNRTIRDKRGVLYLSDNLRYTEVNVESKIVNHTTQLKWAHWCRPGVNDIQGPAVKASGLPELFLNQILGDCSKTVGGGRTYFLRTDGNGHYELSIKTVEVYIDTPHRRFFTIKINNHFVIREFVIQNIAHICEGIELIIEIEIKDNNLTIAGYDPIPMQLNGTINLSIYCGDNQNTGFLVSAFYFVKMQGPGNNVKNIDFCDYYGKAYVSPKHINKENVEEEQLICYNPLLNLDSAFCKILGCFYSRRECLCQPKYKTCTHSTGLTKCRRSNSFYNSAGSICYSKIKEDLGECSHNKTIVAINMGCQCDSCETTDSKGVVYLPDSYRYFTDKNGTRNTVTLETLKCKRPLPKIPSNEAGLYTYFVTGKDEMPKSSCMTYHSVSPGNGNFELNIKTLSIPTEVVFTVKLNNIVILQEFNANRYVDSCNAMDVITEFEVLNGVLNVHGFSSQTTANGRFELDFCYESQDQMAKYSLTYVAAAFYIVKMSTAYEQVCKAACFLKTTDILGCKTAGCEYNNETKVCEIGPKECSHHPGITGCRRPNVVYSYSGVICRSPVQENKGNCLIKSKVLAINLGGSSITDSRNVVYAEWGKEISSDLSYQVIVNTTLTECKENIDVAPESEKSLYITQITASNNVSESEKCALYKTNISHNGHYELSVKTLEIHPSVSIKRFFNIQLNELVVVPEINIGNYASPCSGLEIIVEFKISEGNLTVAGFPAVPLDNNNTITVGFCKSNLELTSLYDINYLVSAFYIAWLH